MRLRNHWIALFIVVFASFAVLLSQKKELDNHQPPIPTQVVSEDGRLLFDGESILDGQNVWQSLGGQQLGSVWGHGAYVAPDWSADYLHREAELVLARWSLAEGATTPERLTAERRAMLEARLRTLFRKNDYDAARQTLVLPPERVEAFEALSAHYARVFRDGEAAYAIPRGTLTDSAKARDLARFFFWASWASAAERPGTSSSYTMNWPHEPLVGNVPTPGTLLWSIASVVLLLAGIAALAFYHVRSMHHEEPAEAIPMRDPLSNWKVTPSQRATVFYFVTAALLFVLQVGLGGLLAHYGVEGDGFYGFDLASILPYAVARTWHTQLGVFWIATAWLGTGLFLAPLIGHEPRGQRPLVFVLFGALVLVVLGALGGTWASAMQRLSASTWYWFGHQGWEYVDLGRAFQLALFAGLGLWLFLMVRALFPALSRSDDRRSILTLFVLSTVAIGLFYGAGLMYGQRTPMAQVEYWRWWVVHLWVEGFFEVFATSAIAYVFVHLGLLPVRRAAPAVILATAVFLGGGIIGTLHHLYFSGTPQSVLALGAVFSALEVVPLTLVAFEVYEHVKLAGSRPWVARYAWPVRFFVAVAIWNLIGAGVFGFLINPPISLYYLQGLNLTPVHGHTALFGVYGFLGLGLAIFCLRVMTPGVKWSPKILNIAFWSLNGGLATMVVFSLLPIGILQAIAAVERGTWWARSSEFMQTPLMQTLRWLRVPGDTLFAVGAVFIAWIIIRLGAGILGKSTDENVTSASEEGDEEAIAPAE